MTLKIDVHTHLYPASYMKQVEDFCKSPVFVKVGDFKYRMTEGDTVMGHIDGQQFVDPDYRATLIPKLGLDAQVISTPLPGAERFEKSKTVELQELINNELAAVCKKYPKLMPNFLCSLSWKDVSASLKEMKRAQGMGAVGILLPSNIHGRAVSDPEFEPIFAQAAELGMMLECHPTVPLTGAACNVNGLPWQLFGFTMDTSMATIGCVYKGYLEKYPNLMIMTVHTGGTIPFLAQRIANSHKKYAETYKDAGQWVKSDRPFMDYIKKLYFDNASWNSPAFKCAYEVVGINNLVLGTDFPHRAGGDWRADLFIAGLDWLTDEEKDKIYSGNIKRMLKLKI